MRVKVLQLTLLIFGSVLISACATVQHKDKDKMDVVLPENAQQLVQLLRTGGLHIYFRHAHTNWQQRDAENLDLNKCSQQRNLSKAGRKYARQIGAAMRALNVPVGRVMTSPFCRCVDTAELAFKRHEIQNQLLALATAPLAVKQERVAWLQGQFQQVPEQQTNIVYVSHQYNFIGAANNPINEADAAIIKPRGGGGFDILAILSADQWRQLARQFSKR